MTHVQRLTLKLDGITAGDYLAWVRDPEPPALGLDLCSVTVRGDPLGDTVEALLSWRVSPPDGVAAGPAAGLPLTPEVIFVTSQTDPSASWRSWTTWFGSPRGRARSCGSSSEVQLGRKRGAIPLELGLLNGAARLHADHA
jgi:hypothetical protein